MLLICFVLRRLKDQPVTTVCHKLILRAVDTEITTVTLLFQQRHVVIRKGVPGLAGCETEAAVFRISEIVDRAIGRAVAVAIRIGIWAAGLTAI